MIGLLMAMMLMQEAVPPLMDVPAVPREEVAPEWGKSINPSCPDGFDLRLKDTCNWDKNQTISTSCTDIASYVCVKPATCADKSRVLLTAEDGTKHCVKFK